MRLLKLVLHKYTRLRLNLIETLTYEPVAIVQMIIGTNGSGKSSLINECSPLTPDKEDYDKGGYKHATFDHDGVVFELRSEFNDSQHHSFIRDGKQLNEGGTVTVQNELVRQHFKYTPDIHAILTGENNFTRMSASERKKWFTLLADTNYDYAVAVFKRVSEKYNENRHALKRTKDRLVIESAKLLPQADVEHLREQCSVMYSTVQKLIERRQPTIESAESLLQKSTKITDDLLRIANTIVPRLRKLKPSLPRTVEEVNVELLLNKHKLDTYQAQSDQYFTDFERMQQLLHAMQATHLENAAQIQNEISTCTQEAALLKKQLTHVSIDAKDPTTSIASCEKLLEWWPNVQDNLHDNREKNWGRAAMTKLTDEIDILSKKKGQYSQLVIRTEQTIEHQTKHANDANITCPQCKHQFQPNFSDQELQNAQRRLIEVNGAINTLDIELKAKTDLRDEMQAYFNTYTTVIQQIRNLPGMQGFFDLVTRDNILLHYPNTFTTVLSSYRNELGTCAKIQALQERITQANALAQMLSSQENLGADAGVVTEYNRLEKLVGDCEHNKQLLIEHGAALTAQKAILEGLEGVQATIEEGLGYVSNFRTTAADSLRRETFAKMLRELQSQLAFKEQALMAAERQQSVIEHLEHEIEELSELTADLKLLLQELSPNEGLIAEGLFGFMTVFIEQMNQTIESLFTYTLRVQPCSTEDSSSLNLTYKFPLFVDGKVRKDVSKGSSGMREAIDLAFKIAAMKALGLNNYPLFLDEFGKTLDPVHKQASVALIVSLMELEQFDQLFLISHDITQYDALANAEFVVLHDANVQLPPNCAYNTHCLLE